MIEITNKTVDFKSIPTNPGVYIYRDEKNEIIYIGKAKNLRNRIKSYFQSKTDMNAKTQVLVSKIRKLDFIIVNNEVEALLLENNLIKKNSPKYNITLKDAKTYAYIKITNDKFPRIMSTRKIENDGAKYFGPYVDGMMRRELIRLVVQIYKISTCDKPTKKACLQYHMGLCSGPCIDEITKEEYDKNVKSAVELLKGNTHDAIDFLENEMKGFSKRKEYEKALSTRRKIEDLQALFENQNVDRQKRYNEDVIVMIQDGARALITMFGIAKGTILGKKEFTFDYSDDIMEEFIKIYYSSIDAAKIPNEVIVNKISPEDKGSIESFLSKLKGSGVSILVPQRGEKAGLVKLAIENAQLNLTDNASLVETKNLLGLSLVPKIIECFDISNLGYEHIVAGMVRFTNAKPDRKEYRKFLIRGVHGKNDDFESMREVIYRRYKKLKEENLPMPDLVIVDGGKGQLGAALESLQTLGLQLKVIGLAKENEEIYVEGNDLPLIFKKNTKMMLLIRQIRDETHRFTISYNKKRREMKTRNEFKEIGRERKSELAERKSELNRKRKAELKPKQLIKN